MIEDIIIEEEVEDDARELEFDGESNAFFDGDYGESSKSDYAPVDDILEASNQEDVFKASPLASLIMEIPFLYVLCSRPSIFVFEPY